MSSIRTWIYFNRLNGSFRWHADVQCGDTMLYGLNLEVSDGACKRVSLISQPHFDEICALLRDPAAREQLQQHIFSRFKAYYRKRPGIRLDNAQNNSEITPSGSERKEWVLFHKKDWSNRSNEYNFSANVVLASGAELSGVQVLWAEADSIRIYLPSADEMIQAREFAESPAVWRDICLEVCNMYARRSGQIVPPGLQDPAAPGKKSKEPQAGTAEIAETKPETANDVLTPAKDRADNCVANALPTPENGVKPEDIPQKKPRGANRYGRVKNSEDSGLLKYTPGNVLRPTAMIEKMQNGQRYNPQKPNTADCIKGLSTGMISVQDIEILSHIADFRYITSAMLIDLYGSGYIPHSKTTTRFSQDHVNKRIKNLTGFGLITPCRFISTTESGDFDFSKLSIGRIHVLDQTGGLVLRELGREASARAFDVYQDGRTVRERLCVNQWAIYWISAYPEVIGQEYGFNQILYRLDHEMSGARMPAWVYVHDQLLIGQYVRRCNENDREANDQEMLGKLKRIGILFDDLSKLCQFDGDEYTPVRLTKRPIINYICEDEAHMHSTIEKLRPLIPEGQEIWFTWDQRLFNYCYEGQRFWRLFSGKEPELIDPGQVFGIGQERKEEKRLDAQDEAAKN